MALMIKQELEDYGFSVFLAHEDIEPSIEWRDRILTELKKCKVFVPVLTGNFNDSEWTDQETGIALAHKKVIVPLKTARDPHGFIKEIQALRIDPENAAKSCLGIIRAMAAASKIKTQVKDDIIKAFCASESFNDTAKKVAFIKWHNGVKSKHLTMLQKKVVNGVTYEKIVS